MGAGRRWAVTGGAVAAALLGSCGQGANTAEPTSSGPPPVVLVDQDVTLEPWAACWTTGCFDGPEPGGCLEGSPVPVHVGSAAAVPFSFDADGWSFTGQFRMPGTCRERPRGIVERLGPRCSQVLPPARPGTYDVDLFGTGPEGDVAVTFRWRLSTEPEDGTPPPRDCGG